MIYEIREYVGVPGRFPALVEMFNEHTMRLFAKHQMGAVAVGMNWGGENSFNGLTYTVRFEDAGDLEPKWARFLQHPEFLAAAETSEVGGPVVQSMTRRGRLAPLAWSVRLPMTELSGIRDGPAQSTMSAAMSLSDPESVAPQRDRRRGGSGQGNGHRHHRFAVHSAWSSVVGIESILAPMTLRHGAWQLLDEFLDLDRLETVTEVIGFGDAAETSQQLIAGKSRGPRRRRRQAMSVTG